MALHQKQTETIKNNLIVVLIEHDDNLGHVVEFGDGAEVIHGSLPLLVLLLLSQTQNTSVSTFTPIRDPRHDAVV